MGRTGMQCMRRWLRVCVLRDFNGYGGHGVWFYILCVWGVLAWMCGKACSDGGYLPKGMIPSRPYTSRRARARLRAALRARRGRLASSSAAHGAG